MSKDKRASLIPKYTIQLTEDPSTIKTFSQPIHINEKTFEKMYHDNL